MLLTGTSKFFQGHLAELQHFVNSLNDDTQPSPTGEDGVKNLEVIEKVYKNQTHLN